jgi:glucose/mannose-6-phosphate isomerase
MLEKETIDLDDLQVYPRFDPQGMLTHLRNFPGLCEQAWEMAGNFQLPEEYARIKKIVILGMGGSAIGGDLVGSLAINEAAVPVLVCRDYYLPQYVNEDTLVIASSYSGMTEETLSSFEQAFDTPAKKLAITTGGKLKSLCETMEVPVFTFNYTAQPRAALPFSFFILLGILQNLKVLKYRPEEISETFAALKSLAARINETVPIKVNPAKSLAKKIQGRLPVIYGAGITGEVAHRWKTQINENSKTTAFYEVFSELNHNSIVGYSFPEELIPQTIIVMLDSDLLHERIRLRYNITQQLLDRAGIYYQVVRGEGFRAVSQMMTLVLFGDYVSYYLAILNQADPTTITAINFLKDSLSKR